MEDPALEQPATSKSRKYQVSVRVIEAKQLAGVELSPFIDVQVGAQHKRTATKKLTVSPFYDEYFVFDFDLPASFFFDQLITLQAYSKGLLTNTVIGTFKIDVATVYNEEGHSFFHKWALLLDPTDPVSGPKGYLKCDIYVVERGDVIKTQTVDKAEEDDIDANLLLPEGMPGERVPAQYTVKIFMAEGLPEVSSGLGSNIRKSFTISKNLVSPYVRVLFAGHTASTSIKRHTSKPVWNEELIFRELFPPLIHRMKIQLRDSTEAVIATRFLELDRISDDSVDGFMPTFGPAYLNFYGSLREDKNHNKTPVNFGIGEAVAFRGRVLLSLEVIASDDIPKPKSKLKFRLPGRKKVKKRKKEDFVTVKNIKGKDVITGDMLPAEKEFLLFCCIHEASMIPKKYNGKPLHFEISIGNYGYVSDDFKNPEEVAEEATMGRVTERQQKSAETKEKFQKSEYLALFTAAEADEREGIDDNYCYSVSPPVKSTLRNDLFCRLPFNAEKPSLSIREGWGSDYKRIYTSNLLKRLADSIADRLNGVAENCHPGLMHLAVRKLKIMLQRLSQEFGQVMSQIQRNITLADRDNIEDLVEGKLTRIPTSTQLDKERFKWLKKRFSELMNKVNEIIQTVNEDNIEAKIGDVLKVTRLLRQVAYEPQEPFPDIFLWLVHVNQRIAYARFPAADILYSSAEEDRGKNCGRMQNFFLKAPETSKTHKDGNNALYDLHGEISAYLWFGPISEMGRWSEGYLSNMPKGYSDFRTSVEANITSLSPFPPRSFNYEESHDYEMRCHLYMAESLIGADDSGLSDPYVRIVFRGHVIESRVIPQTNSPFWDEMLVLSGIRIYGIKNDVVSHPPRIVCEIFDEDIVGADELIGHFDGIPQVTLSGARYTPPKLKWHPVWRHWETAGATLAAFELIEVSADSGHTSENVPALPEPTQESSDEPPFFPVPANIRPQMVKYRLDVLFWGLRGLKPTSGGLNSLSPRVEIDCGGFIAQSDPIKKYVQFPNFSENFQQLSVMLPENPTYQPPITIRCLEGRRYGRSTLLGSHTINSIYKFMVVPPKNDNSAVDMEEEEEDSNSSDDSGSKSDLSSNALRSLYGSYDKLLAQGGQQTIMNGDVNHDGNGKSKRSSLKNGSTSGKLKEESPPAGSPEEISFVAEIDDPGELNEGLDESGKTRKGAKGHKFEEYDWWSKYSASVWQYDQERKAATIRPKRPKKIDKMKNVTKKGFRILNILFWNTARKTKAMVSRDSAQVESRPTESLNLNESANPYEGIPVVKIYPEELEEGEGFDEFQDRFKRFELRRGKANEGKDIAVGAFKGDIRLQKYPLSKKTLNQMRLFRSLPINTTLDIVVRVYVIKAYDLSPADPDGRSDAYLRLSYGSTKINDKKNRINGAINPVFGSLYELQGQLPKDDLLTVQVWDWDRVTQDDMIGETIIDIESRFYSRHRATCGIANSYERQGFNAWRDSQKPRQILQKMCRELQLDSPSYENNCVVIGRHKFDMSGKEKKEEKGSQQGSSEGNKTGANNQQVSYSQEEIALYALHHFHEMEGGVRIVPEHVEKRILWNEEQYGIKQGRLEMWIDIFPQESAPSATIDIQPRKPEPYELRIIVYDTKDVILNDYNVLQGVKMSDIYVKGFITPEEIQKTDVHYRSLNGEGNFNWRFIFKVKYIATEDCFVIKQKKTFQLSDVEDKVPSRLTLQLWDADSISADDQLGTLELPLTRMPRGSAMARGCNLEAAMPSYKGPYVNLFKQGRTRGWWPFVGRDKNGDPELAGKADLELELITEEDAIVRPAGIAREEPMPLPPPKRPETSFAWFANPLKTFKFAIWDGMKYKLLVFFLAILGIIFAAKFIYGLPDYAAARIMGING